MTFKIDSASDLIMDIRYVPSPNADDRPPGESPSLIVIHGISLPPGEFGGGYIEQLFTNRLGPQVHPAFEEIADLKVSSHLLVDRDGRVTQFVPFCKRAWHAGVSTYQGRSCCNDFSIGIELEGTDELEYAEIQYQVLTELIECLLFTYNSLSPKHITGHSDIAPGRKTDPGPAFDWAKLSHGLAARLG